MKTFLFQLAQTISPDEVGLTNTSGDDIFTAALNTFYFIAGTVAVIVIIVTGITYASSGGDSSKVTKAKNQILYSVIGLVLVFSAFAITNFVIGSF